MDRRINKKIEEYVGRFKTDVMNKLQSTADTGEVINYIYNYGKFELEKDDFMKRKRVKNVVPVCERCCAKRANDEQCTRRKKDGEPYCGTHVKGTPHGIVDASQTSTVNKKIDVWAQDIRGIMYYIDDYHNVYNPEDILSNAEAPRVIAKYVKNGDNISIPALF